MPQFGETRQDIEIDRDRNLIVVRISGFFSAEAAHRATMETRAAIRSLGSAVGQHLTLYDMTDAAAATAETVELIRMGFVNPVYKPIWARRVAFCSPSQLLRRQLERIREGRPDIGLFDTRDEALAYLLAP